MMRKLLGLAILAPAFVLLGAAKVQAENTCPDGFLTGLINDNVLVDASSGRGTPPSGNCVLRDAVVTGSLKIEAGGSANVRESIVLGNVLFDFGTAVVVFASTIVGDVQIKGAQPTIFSGIARSTVINGNVLLEENTAQVSADSNLIFNGDMQAFNNSGQVRVGLNVINNGNLQCQDNAFAPTGLGPNIVLNGTKEGQCSGL